MRRRRPEATAALFPFMLYYQYVGHPRTDRYQTPPRVTHEGGQLLEPAELAKIIVDAAADKKASDIALLDIRELSVIADYFVICTGMNSRQINAIVSAIDDKLSEAGVRERGREGSADTGWVLIDVGDVIVHVFGPMEREFYRLERLWSDAPTVMYLQ